MSRVIDMSRVLVVHKPRRSAPPTGRPAAVPMDMADLRGRVDAIFEKAKALQGVSRVRPDQFAIEKDELVRTIGRLRADLRERGVR